MTFGLFLQLLLRRWWVIVLATMLTVTSTLYYVQTQPEIYSTSGMLELRPSPALSEGQQISLVNILNNRRTTINNIARKATNGTMYDLIATRLGSTASEVRGAKVTATVLPETNLIVISASGRDPQALAAIVNTTAEILAEQNTDRIFEASLIDRAQIPRNPASRPYQLMASLGLVSGLAMGVVIILAEYGLMVLWARRKEGRDARKAAALSSALAGSSAAAVAGSATKLLAVAPDEPPALAPAGAPAVEGVSAEASEQAAQTLPEARHQEAAAGEAPQAQLAADAAADSAALDSEAADLPMRTHDQQAPALEPAHA